MEKSYEGRLLEKYIFLFNCNLLRAMRAKEIRVVRVASFSIQLENSKCLFIFLRFVIKMFSQEE